MRSLITSFFLLAALSLQAQQEGVPFNGIVSDITGAPLKGAKVYVSSPNFYSKSDKKGRFGLTDVNPNDTIHVVYRKQTYLIPVEGRKSIRIRLGDQISPVAMEDEDLVNWGYGFVKRRESLDVSNGISGEDLIRSGRTNILEALQGRVPGLNVSTTSRLGADPEVRMRGISSLNLPLTPLFIVDGIIVETLEFVNVYDVDHVEILKDGSVYGAQGANGAILVTTKRGK